MAGGGGEGELGIQIAPMLDVMFVLMLFFMVMAGSKTTEGEMGIDLPSSGASYNQEKAPVPIFLRIDDLGQVFFNDDKTDSPKSRELQRLQQKLDAAIKQYGVNNPVILIPSETTHHSRIIDVMNACVAAGVTKLSFGSGND
jgi:biopolymer transport protein ExbD